MASAADSGWLPLDEAAALMKRNVSRIKSQMRNGSIQRDRHFRCTGGGEFELHVLEYLRWLAYGKEQRKLPLTERITRDVGNRESHAPRTVTLVREVRHDTAPSPPASKPRPRLIPLQEWAIETFGKHAPHRHTLRNWVNSGKIRPMPIKVGRSYFVSPDARYVDPAAEEIQRMIDGRNR